MKVVTLAAMFLLITAGGMLAQEMRWYVADSSRWVLFNVLAQPWLRYNESNPGTTVAGELAESTVDVGIRRMRLVMTFQVTDRALLFVQYGMNNFNSTVSVGANRKQQAFFHDAYAEYRITDQREALLGIGLSGVNGLSRFTLPAAASIMTMDVPVFLQATVDQTDELSRKLSVSARGQIGPIDYRIALSDPFLVTSSGSVPPPIAPEANFSQSRYRMQSQAYVIWQFLEHEPHTTYNMPGTYLGTRSVFNIAGGIIHQPDAMWRLDGADTVYEDMTLACVESFLDVPLNTNLMSLNAYLGVYLLDYGTKYLRYNGVMNPATGMDTTGIEPEPLTDVGQTFGNSFPMFGTGTAAYAQLGIHLPQVILGAGLLPYASAQIAQWERVPAIMDVYNLGASVLFDGHRSKLSFDVQNRPTYGTNREGAIVTGKRRHQLVLQYQIAW